jgi:hypothetical protein
MYNSRPSRSRSWALLQESSLTYNPHFSSFISFQESYS